MESPFLPAPLPALVVLWFEGWCRKEMFTGQFHWLQMTWGSMVRTQSASIPGAQHACSLWCQIELKELNSDKLKLFATFNYEICRGSHIWQLWCLHPTFGEHSKWSANFDYWLSLSQIILRATTFLSNRNFVAPSAFQSPEILPSLHQLPCLL